MRRVLGYGGLGNSRARDFSGKAEAEEAPSGAYLAVWRRRRRLGGRA